MKTRLLIIIPALLLSACKVNTGVADAFGNFEATEIVVSAETNGRIIRADASEGVQIDRGDVIALIDTTMIYLQKAEIDAAMGSIKSKISSINAQNEILYQQIKNLNVNVERTERMLKGDAATQKQLDDLSGQVSVIEKQVAANNTQKVAVAAELQVYKSKKATLNEQVFRSFVKSPVNGTVLEKYSEAGEATAAGKPLVKIADLSLMKLKVYVSGAQLGGIKIGQKCVVRIDNGEKGYASLTGTISFIAGKAEFTPKIIQTKEERVTLVYAVKIDVINDGSLKSGMPGEAIFSTVNN